MSDENVNAFIKKMDAAIKAREAECAPLYQKIYGDRTCSKLEAVCLVAEKVVSTVEAEKALVIGDPLGDLLIGSVSGYFIHKARHGQDVSGERPELEDAVYKAGNAFADALIRESEVRADDGLALALKAAVEAYAGETAERFGLHSHAERGNENLIGECDE